MSNRSEHRKVAAKRAGKGGVNCYCCDPSPREKKKFFRTIRRILKRKFRKELDSAAG